jgi:hypothetical protein
MRRIDLFCKLIGPLAISLVDGISTTIAILVTLGLNLASVMVEYYTIAKVRPKTLLWGSGAIMTPTWFRSTDWYQHFKFAVRRTLNSRPVHLGPWL